MDTLFFQDVEAGTATDTSLGLVEASAATVMRGVANVTTQKMMQFRPVMICSPEE
jgi:hypothetical protein